MFKKYTIIALGALMLGGQASGMGAWARKLWAPSAVAAVGVFGAKTALCEEKPVVSKPISLGGGWEIRGRVVGESSVDQRVAEDNGKPKSMWQRFKDALQYGPESIRDVAPKKYPKSSEEMFVRCTRPEVGRLKSGEHAAFQHCWHNEYSPMHNFQLVKNGDTYEDKSVLAYQGNEMKIEMPADISTNLQRLIREHEKAGL